MAKRYRMTAARKAALRKAQLASARKRRRRTAVKRVATVVGGVGVVFATRRLNKYGDNPRLIGRDYRDAKNAIKTGRSRFKNRKANKRIRRQMKRSGNSFQYGPWV